ncbi:MAG TPA: tRNA (adenosine(37)-N6)-threonylcarbamoyltransferase complex dimerization subunit type 1 TsaB [Steroidobacteraceae bacterium]|nr:tRNA (adenosine(37)-N6)-threonylcarbamoyltransferase complex dimerization subunit type 1 TsaB [Steroidobacteraceae bacterium]
MKLLALDTATEALSVSLATGSARIDRYIEIERGHAEQILPMIESVLAEGGVALGSLDAIAFGRGPGGFTGVRLAASVAQGLAFGAGVGVIPVSDLAAVAWRTSQLDATARQVLVVNDARMREVYWGRFPTDPLLISMEHEERVDLPAAVVLGSSPEKWVAAGRGLRAWPELAERCRQAGAAGLFPDILPSAAGILALATGRAMAGQILDPALALPVYVRDRVAEPAP